MRIALISDVHANLEALEAVLEDIDKQHVDKIFCLGDVVGYGPNPRETVQMVHDRAGLEIMGNHDKAVLEEGDLPLFGEHAKESIFLTRKMLTQEEKRIISGYSASTIEDGKAYFHGMPLDCERYMMQIWDFKDAFGYLQDKELTAGFYGHTHIPVVSFGSLQAPMCSPAPIFPVPNMPIQLNGATLVNVGSVGQPRDRDNRACYAILDNDKVSYRRVDYDFQKTQRKILALELPEIFKQYLANRLAKGK